MTLKGKGPLLNVCTCGWKSSIHPSNRLWAQWRLGERECVCVHGRGRHTPLDWQGLLCEPGRGTQNKHTHKHTEGKTLPCENERAIKTWRVYWLVVLWPLSCPFLFTLALFRANVFKSRPSTRTQSYTHALYMTLFVPDINLPPQASFTLPSTGDTNVCLCF